jgi:NADH-quinone oxidoreductase subunit M
MVRTGVFPTHIWLTELFAVGPVGQFLVFVTPIVGVYPAVRIALPVAPEWVLAVFAMVAVVSALYTAAMACVQTDARRFFAYFFVSHASLVLVGLGLNTPFAVTGAMLMWLSSALSLAGVGLTLRAVAARVGSLSLTQFRGLYDHSPMLAVCLLLTGLSSVGFPGTSGFVAIELLVDEAVGSHLIFGLLIVSTAALNGIAVVRVYVVLFTGCRHVTGVDLRITTRERVAVLTLMALILGGGVAPQAYLESRYQMARGLLRDRPSPPAGPHAPAP